MASAKTIPLDLYYEIERRLVDSDITAHDLKTVLSILKAYEPKTEP